MEGWVKLHRSILEDPIWTCTTVEQKVVVMTLLMMVNFEPKQWFWGGQKFDLLAGQVVTSLDSIAEKTGKKGRRLSIQNVRTALVKLENMGFLTNESTKVGRIVTLVNWGKYQETNSPPNKASNKDLTNDQQRANKELTPTKEVKKLRSEEGKKKDFPEDSPPSRLASLLFEKIRENDPKAKGNPKKWAEHIDKLIRLDKREPKEIEQVIIWSQQDKFWSTNILSSKSLRDKFQTLRAQMIQKGQSWDIDEIFKQAKANQKRNNAT